MRKSARKHERLSGNSQVTRQWLLLQQLEHLRGLTLPALAAVLPEESVCHPGSDRLADDCGDLSLPVWPVTDACAQSTGECLFQHERGELTHASASRRQQESFSLVAQDDAPAGDGLDLEFVFNNIAFHVAAVLDVDQSFRWVRSVGH